MGCYEHKYDEILKVVKYITTLENVFPGFMYPALEQNYDNLEKVQKRLADGLFCAEIDELYCYYNFKDSKLFSVELNVTISVLTTYIFKNFLEQYISKQTTKNLIVEFIKELTKTKEV